MAKNPTIKRILKEAAELSQTPSPDYHAQPLEADLYTWHFTLRGPSPPSPFGNGIYHGQITLPPSYPLKPPNFRFLTPSGRFEVNREICLSISGHHEETWQPAWGIRTALVAIRAFMDSDAGGQLGGMNAAENVKTKLAAESRRWTCAGCGGLSNEDILGQQEDLCKSLSETDEEKRRREEEEASAKGISFAPKKGGEEATAADKKEEGEKTDHDQEQQAQQPVSIPPTPTPTRTITPPAQHPPHAQRITRDVWVDRAIIGIVCALLIMVARRLI